MTTRKDNTTEPTPDQMAAEQAPKDSLPSERASLLDVFENFLGASIAAITDHHLENLAPSEANELVEQIDIFLEAASAEDFPEDAVALDGFASPIIIPFDRTEPQTTRRAQIIEVTEAQTTLVTQRSALYQAVFDYQVALARLKQGTGQ
jgi:hypothetical protein